MIERIGEWMRRRGEIERLVLVMLVAELLFVWRIGDPATVMFDETHYLPAARAVFAMTGPMNAEHPLFAKWLIGLSMALFGDDPAGWRMLSTVAGAISVGAVYWIALRLFGNARAGAMAAFATVLDQFVYIQARIAMLDVYMGAFLLIGAALLADGYRATRGNRWRVAGAGLCFGLACGCKWAAAPVAIAMLAGVMALRARDAWRERTSLSGFLFGHGARRWTGISLAGMMALAAALALIAYAVTFAPALFYADHPIAPGDLIAFQREMYQLQTQPLATHPNQSPWWSWPLMAEPIWYFYEPVDCIQRGVLLIGNPVILWGGLIAVAACLWWGVRRNRPALIIAAAGWGASYGIWALIPKKIGFLYYYYVPAIMLSLAIAGALDEQRRQSGARWVTPAYFAAAGGMFLYFLPIISAGALDSDQAFLRWMWFDGWQ